MRTDMTITLQEGLKRLKLRRISDTYEGYNQTALAEQWSYLDFLTTLVKEEIASREHTGYEKRLKAAHFPSLKTLEDFDFEFQRSVLKPKIMDLARLDFISKAENVVLIGPPGVGNYAKLFVM
jgi:DNA replication protein DnaC